MGVAAIKSVFATKWLVSTTVFILVCYFRDATMFCIVAFAIINAKLSKWLKSIFRQPRPPTAPQSDYGMPSSHAQSLLFLSTTLSLYNPGTTISHAAMMLGLCASGWRVRVGYHTPSQVWDKENCSFALGYHAFSRFCWAHCAA